MHKKAQYIDGKLIEEDGKEINEVKKPPLHLKPPTPVFILDEDDEEEEEEDENEHPRRKNISISYETWTAWKQIKGRKNWDAVLIDALEIFHKIKKLEDVIIQVALQKPTIIQQVGVPIQEIPARIPSANPRLTPILHKKKLPFLEEIKELVGKLEAEGKDIRSFLIKPEENEKEIKKIQKSDEELKEIQEKAIQRMKGG